MKKRKIQALIVEHLLKYGQLEILLPDSVKLEIKNGELVRKDDYCWVIASREGRSTSLDAYNMGLRFSDDERVLVFEDKFIDRDGDNIRRLDVV